MDEKSLIIMTLIYSCHWKTPCTFLLVKEKTWKRIFNTNSELSQNRTEKQIMQSKTIINWLFKDIWSWLKNWRFSAVVKVYYIVNYCHKELHFKEVQLFYILFKCSSHLQHKCLENTHPWILKTWNIWKNGTSFSKSARSY